MTHVDHHSPASPQIKSLDATTMSEKQGKEKEKEKEKDEKKKKGKKGDEADDGELTKTTHELELSQDDAIDPAPFHFKPFQLAHMLDPKSLSILTSLGGVKSLLRGLGVDANHGLSSASASTKADQGAPRVPLLEKTHEHFAGSEKLPEITLTEPGGTLAPPTVADYSAAFNATLEDRRLVFGENVLPTRVSKTLLQLMWLALQDKVLVCSVSVSIFFPRQSSYIGFRSCFQLPRLSLWHWAFSRTLEQFGILMCHPSIGWKASPS